MIKEVISFNSSEEKLAKVEKLRVREVFEVKFI